MGAFIASQLKYPKAALEKKIEGVVLVKYDIDYKGKVVDAKVAKSLGHGCDEEAIRIVKLFEFEIPKGPRKLRVLFHQKAKIYFKLPKPATKKIEDVPKAPGMAISYNYVTTPKPKEPAAQPKSKPSYTISIKLK